MKLNKNLYNLDGPYSDIARTLNPYTPNKGGSNRFRITSDDCSLAISKKINEYSFKDLAVLSLNFTKGHDFYTGEKLMTPDQLLVPEETIHRDHLYPASKCGLYSFGNVVITTETANISKSDLMPKEYYKARFDNNESTYFDSLEEAYEAIDYLFSLYEERYPSASRVVKYFDNLKMPMTFSEKNMFIDMPLFAECSDVRFVDIGSKGYTFNYNIKDKDLIWTPLLNKDTVIYKGLAESAVEKISNGCEIVRIGNLFCDLNLDIKELSYDEIISNVEKLIEQNSITTQLLMRRATRALIRHLGYIKGDIDENNEVVNGLYPEIDGYGQLRLKDDWGPNNEFWEPFRDKNSELYDSYSGTSKQKNASASWHIATRIHDKFEDASIYEIDFDELKDLFDDIASDSSYEVSKLVAMRRVMKIVANELGYEWKPPRKSN